MKKTLSILIILLCISCGDEFIPYYLIIDNQTSDTINITLPLNHKEYSFISLPNTKNDLLKTNIRVIQNFNCDPLIEQNKVKIKTSSGRKLNKEMWNANNWECNGSTYKGWALTFIITENDLE